MFPLAGQRRAIGLRARADRFFFAPTLGSLWQENFSSGLSHHSGPKGLVSKIKGLLTHLKSYDTTELHP
jgi:hypothetical protein